MMRPSSLDRRFLIGEFMKQMKVFVLSTLGTENQQPIHKSVVDAYVVFGVV
jgi:hypothetical protein